MRSDKVMLPEIMMRDPAALRGWIARAFKAAAKLPPKAAKPAKPAKTRSANAKSAKPKPVSAKLATLRSAKPKKR
jgi:hypothetical protein